MGIFDIFKGFRTNSDATQGEVPKNPSRVYAGLQQGYTVDYDKFIEEGFNNVSINTAINEIFDGLSNLNWYVSDGENEVKNDYVTKTLSRPTSNLSISEFIKYFFLYYKVGGRALVKKVKGRFSADLYLYAPRAYTIKYLPNGIDIDYIEIEATKEKLSGVDLDDYYLFTNFDATSKIAGYGDGQSELKPIAPIGDLSNNIIKWNNSLLEEMGCPPGIITTDANLDDDQFEEFKKKLKRSVSGKENAGKFMFLDGASNTSVDFLGITPKDFDWIQGFDKMHEYILSKLKVPIELVGGGNTTFANRSEARKKFYIDTIIPFGRDIARYLTIIFEDDLSDGTVVDFSTDDIAILEESFMDDLEKIDGISYVDTNEKRELANIILKKARAKYQFAPRTDLNADKILVPLNTELLEEIGLNMQQNESVPM